MDIPEPSQLSNPGLNPLPEPAAPVDGFESGRENRLRRWAARFAGFLFKPPRLPWPMALFAMLWIVSSALYLLASLRPEFWAMGRHNLPETGLSELLDISPLAYLGFYLFQMLVVGLLLLVLNRKVALVLWIYTGFEFSFGLGWHTLNIALYTVEVTNRPLVGLIRLLVVGGAALLWGLAFSGGMKVLLAKEGEEGLPYRYPTSLKAALILLIIWMLTTSAVTVRNAIAPQPTWRQVVTENTPAGRYSVSLAYDTSRSQAVLFGGSVRWDENGNWIGLDDTWVWDGNNWIEQHPSQRPSARLDTAMAYDEKRGVIVLFGGQNQGEAMNDTWEWDGAQWVQRTPEVSPQPRCCVELAYDPAREQVVLFSGYAGDRTPPAMQTVFHYDAWAWDGQNWQEISLDRRRHVSNYSMIEHPFQPGSLFIFDTQGMWTWQEDRMRPVDTGQPPGGRWNVGLAYDPNRGILYLYGGRQNGSNETETWRFDGSRWRRVYTAKTPPAREMQGMFFDQTRGRVIMFGGYDGQSFYNDTWELIIP